MRNFLLISTTCLILTGCFFPQVTVDKVENELGIDLQGTPRSLLYHESETDKGAVYYAIEIPENQYEKLIGDWTPILAVGESNYDFDWNEISQEELPEWKPENDMSSSFYKEIQNDGYATAQYHNGWMFVIKKGK